MKSSYIFSLILSIAFLSFLPVEAVSGTRSCAKTTKTSVREGDIDVITFMGYSLVNGEQVFCTTIDGTPQIVHSGDPSAFLPASVTLTKESVNVNGHVNYKASATLPNGVEFATVHMFCDPDEKAGSGWVILESCNIEYAFGSSGSASSSTPVFETSLTYGQLMGVIMLSFVIISCACTCFCLCCKGIAEALGH